MPPTIPTLGTNNQGSSRACSGQTMGYEIIPVGNVVKFSGMRVQSDSKWNQIAGSHINHENQWKPIDSVYVIKDGKWEQSASEVQEGTSKTRIKLTMCGGFEVCGDVGGNSPMVYQTPNQLYVPQGWKFRTIRWSARYDDSCDGVFLAQSQNLANFLAGVDPENPTIVKRKALILCRRSSPVYTSLSSATAACGGVNASAFQWTTPTWAYLSLPNSAADNQRTLQLYSRNTTNNNGMCGGATTVVPLIHDNYALPFAVDQIISMRSNSNCGKFRCNHYLCDNSSFLEFDEP
jgi:hypothetical protein